MAKKKAASTEVVKKEASGLPATIMEEMAKDAGGGMEGMSQDDLAIPFIGIIQNGSPQRSKTKAEYIKDADEGMFFNTVSNRLYNRKGEGMLVIPCAYERLEIEWRLREKGGGFVAIHKPTDPIVDTVIVNDKRQRIVPNTDPPHQLVTTAQHYILVLDPEDGSWKRAVIAFTSTQLPKSRKWNTIMGEKSATYEGKTFTPPSYAYQYRLTTVPESNDLGNWFGVSIEDAGPVPAEVYALARTFSRQVSQSKVRTAPPPPESGSSGSSGSKPAPPQGVGEDNLPY